MLKSVFPARVWRTLVVLLLAVSSTAAVEAGTRFFWQGPAAIRIARPYRFARSEAILRNVAAGNIQPYWVVHLSHPRWGRFTRTFRVDNSGQALSRARAAFPGATVTAARKIWR